ncbi:MAG: hypothetical protein E7363_06425 [Clostridiales bacterium]|nr:hypothetical protein [Clostridiales bacterium]
MKRKLVMLLLVVCFSVCGTLGLTACGEADSPQKLTAPTVTLTGNVASWAVDSNAEKFEISIDGTLSYIENTKTSITLNEGQTFKIRAIGNGTAFTTGKWSNTVTYIVSSVAPSVIPSAVPSVEPTAVPSPTIQPTVPGASPSVIPTIPPSVQNPIPMNTCAYSVVSAPMNNGLVVIDSISEKDRNYYLVDLGYAVNVPIWSGGAVRYNKSLTNPPQLTFSKGSQTQSTVEQSVSDTISKTVTDINTGSASVEIGVEIGDPLGVLKGSLKTSYSRQWGTTTDNTNSTTSAYSTAESIAETYNTEVVFATGGYGYGYYRLAMLATCDIYAYIETSWDNTEVYSITYSTCPRDDAALSIEYSENGVWQNNTTEKITLPQDFLTSLQLPDAILIDNEIIDANWDSEEFSTTVNQASFSVSTHTQNINNAQSTSFTIEVSSDYLPLIVRNLLGVEIVASGATALQYRSAASTATATVKARFGEGDYSVIAELSATGGGWPALWIDPAYGTADSEENLTLSTSCKVTERNFVVSLDIIHLVQFEEFQNWAGGTHAVNFDCDLSNVTYRFYIVQ